MSESIINLQQWFDSPPGRYLQAWEQARFDEAVANIFGYHGLQIGMPELDGLRTNRMPHRWLALGGAYAGASVSAHQLPSLLAEPEALPFSDRSLDLVLLPHTLDFSIDPHAALREVERVLVPEGRVVICGMNPVSLWGFRQLREHALSRLGVGRLYLPEEGAFMGLWRLRDWLQLLSFEFESAQFGCYRPAVRSARWLDRFGWMDSAGARWWPILGAAYFVVAVKRVRGMRLLEPSWHKKPAAGTVPVANHFATGLGPNSGQHTQTPVNKESS